MWVTAAGARNELSELQRPSDGSRRRVFATSYIGVVISVTWLIPSCDRPTDARLVSREIYGQSARFDQSSSSWPQRVRRTNCTAVVCLSPDGQYHYRSSFVLAQPNSTDAHCRPDTDNIDRLALSSVFSGQRVVLSDQLACYWSPA